MKNFLSVFIAAALIAAGALSVQAQTETMTLTTYYPSPLGNYAQLRLVPRDGTGFDCGVNNPGTMFYCSQNCPGAGPTGIYTCDGISWQSAGGGVWTQRLDVPTNTNMVYPTNWNIAGTPMNVGIGTDAPGYRLDVEGGQIGVNQTTDDYSLVATNHKATGNAQAGMFSVGGAGGINHWGLTAGAEGATTSNIGVEGTADGPAGSSMTMGLQGRATGAATTKKGVYGSAQGSGGTKYGVHGLASESDAGVKLGVYGEAQGSGGTKYGVYGRVNQADTNLKYGVYGEVLGAGGTKFGVYGRVDQADGNIKRGVYGEALGTGGDKYGVYGFSYADDAAIKTGVSGGARGNGGSKYGVTGATDGTGTNYGVMGSAADATGTATNFGIYGTAWGGADNYAGYFSGTLATNGYLGIQNNDPLMYFWDQNSTSAYERLWIVARDGVISFEAEDRDTGQWRSLLGLFSPDSGPAPQTHKVRVPVDLEVENNTSLGGEVVFNKEGSTPATIIRYERVAGLSFLPDDWVCTSMSRDAACSRECGGIAGRYTTSTGPEGSCGRFFCDCYYAIIAP